LTKRLICNFTFREFCTVLAALRVFQRVREAGGTIPGGGPCEEDTLDELEHFEDADPLTDRQIDNLCERINFTEVASG
jgi:3-deoxy-D-arabino-heptulosonate 7-phosphate (DAHP) synthase class II